MSPSPPSEPSDTPRARRQQRALQRGYYTRQANAIYTLQMKECVIRMTTEGRTDREIARYLGQHPSTIARYRRLARADADATRAMPYITYDTRADPPAESHKKTPRGSGPGPHVRGSTKRYATSDQLPKITLSPIRRSIQDVNRQRSHTEPSDEPRTITPDEIYDGPVRSLSRIPSPIPTGPKTRIIDPHDVEDPEDVAHIRNECLNRRKAMMTFREMAEELHITEQQAREYTAVALRDLQDSVTSHADLERRLMVEQIDDMIRAVRPQTIQTPEGKPPILDAIDRMLKLMDRKSKLLGLDQAEPVDIMIRLQSLADEAKYDITELQEIAKDVLQRHRIKLPTQLLERSDAS